MCRTQGRARRRNTMANPKKILNDPKKVVAEMLDGLLLANDGRVKPGRPARGARAHRHPRRQGRAAHRRRKRPRAAVPRLRRQEHGRRRRLRPGLRRPVARHDRCGRQGGPSRQRHPVPLRQLCRRQHELRHGRRDAGGRWHRSPHGARLRRRGRRAAGAHARPARHRRRHLHDQGGRRRSLGTRRRWRMSSVSR